MNWFRRFFYGRNGTDQLGIAALALAVLLSLLSNLPDLLFLMAPSFLLLAYCIFRMISRNTEARRRENAAFIRAFGKVPRFFKSMGDRRRDMKIHKYYKCPGCKKSLRVPRGKGKVRVRCPQCGFEFVSRT